MPHRTGAESQLTVPTSAQIRARFIEFFESKGGDAARDPQNAGHVFVPSSPVVPHDDPTLLFTNAGMNQYKPIFLGAVEPGSPLEKLRRAVNSQKCIRAGGKHNDLEDVGKDTYHHTFFEMLGNWSFGDYFKAEAIAWAWELLTEVFEIPADRLYATYFEGNEELGLAPDHEARDLWLRHLPPARVLPGDMVDNFWEMGETGPCGPCSEIHYDRIGGRDAAGLVNADDPDVIELWNLVFIQFDRQGPTALKPLPAKHVDTGMGLERLVSVLQSLASGRKLNNYDTDLFMPIFEAIQKRTGARPYEGKVGAEDPERIDMAYRVIADHVRCLAFAIADGATPSNEGRGYVLRRILRRAMGFGRLVLQTETGLLADLVPVVVELMGSAFPELTKNAGRVQQVIREEEESFGRTLDRGLTLLEEAIAEARLSEEGWGEEPNPVIRGDVVFRLYDTFGFPFDFTQRIAKERGVSVDIAGFERAMEAQRERSRAGAKGGESGITTLPPDAIAALRQRGVEATDDTAKYQQRPISATVRSIWNGTDFDVNARPGSGRLHPVALILDRSNCYAEAGGQEFDTGHMWVGTEDRSDPADEHAGGEFRFEKVINAGGYVLHVGHVVRGEVREGDKVQVHPDRARRGPIMAHHTATHLLNFALREVLGEGVEQKGSLVAPDRLRFDFSHPRPVTIEELERVEAIVRELIAEDLEVCAEMAPLAEAQRIAGLRAVFGEKYPDPVRVVSIGQPVGTLLEDPARESWHKLAIEFCGGTHLERTGEAGDFAIVSETGIAKGIRRIEAVAGVPASAAIEAARQLDNQIAEAARIDEAELGGTVPQLAAELDGLTLPAVDRERLRVKLDKLRDRAKQAQKAEARSRAQQAVEQARQIAADSAASDEPFVVARLDLGGDRQAMQQAIATIRSRNGDKAVMLVSADAEAGAVAMAAQVPQPLIERGLKAGDWVRLAAQACGGKGGGKPDQAQGGGRDLGKIDDAERTARSYALEVLEGKV